MSICTHPFNTYPYQAKWYFWQLNLGIKINYCQYIKYSYFEDWYSSFSYLRSILQMIFFHAWVPIRRVHGNWQPNSTVSLEFATQLKFSHQTTPSTHPMFYVVKPFTYLTHNKQVSEGGLHHNRSGANHNLCRCFPSKNMLCKVWIASTT